MDRRISCSSENCGFFVQVCRRRRADQTYGNWYISSLHLEHVNCISSAAPTRRQIQDLATFRSAVHAFEETSAATLIAQVQEREGISLSKKRRTVYRA
uniref:Uncharacterized protein n=1 Tax=Globisporangium ultimum (strain ATCC 200006 / CBS 805.95 / DAOM BR144) TaxID=431595 RepID=K3X0V1_GLOUD